MDARAFREDLYKGLILHATDSYKEVVRVSALIEDKAQKAAALAGVFLGAGFSFIKAENLDPGSPVGNSVTLLLLSLATLLLIAVVVLCIRVLWITAQAAPLSMDSMKKLVKTVSSLPDASLSGGFQDECRTEIYNRWARILKDQIATNEQKAAKVRYAQAMLAASIILIAIALLWVLCGTLFFRLATDVTAFFKG
jgi:hypothetical protein